MHQAHTERATGLGAGDRVDLDGQFMLLWIERSHEVSSVQIQTVFRRFDACSKRCRCASRRADRRPLR
jgi:hypothetical protein